jgi:hypothetical protein
VPIAGQAVILFGNARGVVSRLAVRTIRLGMDEVSDPAVAEDCERVKLTGCPGGSNRRQSSPACRDRRGDHAEHSSTRLAKDGNAVPAIPVDHADEALSLTSHPYTSARNALIADEWLAIRKEKG